MPGCVRHTTCKGRRISRLSGSSSVGRHPRRQSEIYRRGSNVVNERVPRTSGVLRLQTVAKRRGASVEVPIRRL